jgi:sodium/bile acid cotransporter 7
MLKFLAIDRFSGLLLLMVILASVLPISGHKAEIFNLLTTIAIAILFFFHGAKLSREAIIAGLLHWKLHAVVFGITFAVFPVLALLAKPLLIDALGLQLYYGFLFMCCLPSTVQSSIAFTSMAGGNVAAAMCSASFSNIIGMLLTPIMVSFLLLGQQEHDIALGGAVFKILGLLLLPFVLGQLCRPKLLATLQRHPGIVKAFDQGSILMVVYAAFSSAVVAGLWQQVNGLTLAYLLLSCAALLAIIMLLAYSVAKALGFAPADQICVFFCASKKTLAAGIPMAQILFIGQPLGLMVLPIMIFHQLQLMVCALIAAKWAKSAPSTAELPHPQNR